MSVEFNLEISSSLFGMQVEKLQVHTVSTTTTPEKSSAHALDSRCSCMRQVMTYIGEMGF